MNRNELQSLEVQKRSSSTLTVVVFTFYRLKDNLVIHIKTVYKINLPEVNNSKHNRQSMTENSVRFPYLCLPFATTIQVPSYKIVTVKFN